MASRASSGSGASRAARPGLADLPSDLDDFLGMTDTSAGSRGSRASSFSGLLSPLSPPGGSAASSADRRARLAANQRRLDELARGRPLVPFRHREGALSPTPLSPGALSRSSSDPAPLPASTPVSSPLVLSAASQLRLARDFAALHRPLIDQDPASPSGASPSGASSPLSLSAAQLTPAAPSPGRGSPEGPDPGPLSPPSMYRGTWAPFVPGKARGYPGYEEYVPRELEGGTDDEGGPEGLDSEGGSGEGSEDGTSSSRRLEGFGRSLDGGTDGEIDGGTDYGSSSRRFDDLAASLGAGSSRRFGDLGASLVTASSRRLDDLALDLASLSPKPTTTTLSSPRTIPFSPNSLALGLELASLPRSDSLSLGLELAARAAAGPLSDPSSPRLENLALSPGGDTSLLSQPVEISDAGENGVELPEGLSFGSLDGSLDEGVDEFGIPLEGDFLSPGRARPPRYFPPGPPSDAASDETDEGTRALIARLKASALSPLPDEEGGDLRDESAPSSGPHSVDGRGGVSFEEGAEVEVADESAPSEASLGPEEEWTDGEADEGGGSRSERSGSEEAAAIPAQGEAAALPWYRQPYPPAASYPREKPLETAAKAAPAATAPRTPPAAVLPAQAAESTTGSSPLRLSPVRSDPGPPGEVASDHGQEGTASGTASRDEGTVSRDEEAASRDEGSVLIDEDAVSRGEETVSRDEQTVSRDEETVSRNGATDSGARSPPTSESDGYDGPPVVQHLTMDDLLRMNGVHDEPEPAPPQAAAPAQVEASAPLQQSPAPTRHTPAPAEASLPTPTPALHASPQKAPGTPAAAVRDFLSYTPAPRTPRANTILDQLRSKLKTAPPGKRHGLHPGAQAAGARKMASADEEFEAFLGLGKTSERPAVDRRRVERRSSGRVPEPKAAQDRPRSPERREAPSAEAPVPVHAPEPTRSRSQSPSKADRKAPALQVDTTSPPKRASAQPRAAPPPPQPAHAEDSRERGHAVSFSPDEPTPDTLVERESPRRTPRMRGKSPGAVRAGRSAATLVEQDGYLPSEEERREIVQAIRDLGEDNDKLMARLASLSNELLGLQETHAETEKQLRGRIEDAEKARAAAEERVSAAEARIAELGGGSDELRRENLDLIGRLEEMQRGKEAAESGLTARETEVNSLRVRLREERTSLRQLEEELQELRRQLPDSKRRPSVPDPRDSRLAHLEGLVAELQAKLDVAAAEKRTLESQRNSMASAPHSPSRSTGDRMQPQSSASRPRHSLSSPQRRKDEAADLTRQQAQHIEKLRNENEMLVRRTADAVVELKNEHDRVRKTLEDKVLQMEAALKVAVAEGTAEAKGAGMFPTSLFPELLSGGDGKALGSSGVYHALQNKISNLTRQMDALRREHERETRSLNTERDRLVAGYEGRLLAAQKESLRTVDEHTRDLREQLESLRGELGEVRGQLKISELQRKTATERLEAAWKDASGSTEAVLRIAREQGKIRERERAFQNDIRSLRSELEEERRTSDIWKRKAADLQAKLAVALQERDMRSSVATAARLPALAPAGQLTWSEKLERLSRRIAELEDKFALDDPSEDAAFERDPRVSMRGSRRLSDLRGVRSRWEDLSVELSVLEDGGFSMVSGSGGDGETWSREF
ncbi:hypothetical protein DFJ74DRAFT_765164 [Hyaloraphidium curvatum]|nr:hypothetical protein DFJ74DRAFT_765164 [Hyaloraphidium curvatum]